MSRPITRKSPTKSEGFSWGRFPIGDTGVVAYRLFRRDCNGITMMLDVNVHPGMSRSEVALRLALARIELRERIGVLAA